MINVWGDAIASGCVAHLSSKEINDYEMRHKKVSESENTSNSVKFEIEKNDFNFNF